MASIQQVEAIMSIAVVQSRALLGVEAVAVTVEAHISNGLPAFAIVGLPETAVRESKDRVRSAILNSGFDFPSRRITVNLAPADLPKTGGRYDFAIAMGILAASRQVESSKLASTELLGELALDGSLRRVFGVIPSIQAAARARHTIIIPTANRAEMNLVGNEDSWSVSSLIDYVAHLRQGEELAGPAPNETSPGCDCNREMIPVRGQLAAKRALLIAAAGNHNLLMIGPPGSGKTLLANLLAKLLPPLNADEAMEVAAIRSVSNVRGNCRCWFCRPVRSPHHGASGAALAGGGSKAQPGEVSLAHRGLLFLDELTEFKPNALEALREPLESGEITISRANYRLRFPARFQLAAAMNPCPCGYFGDTRHECRCSQDRIDRYLGRISGPLLDRIDIVIEVAALSQAELLSQAGEVDQHGLERLRYQVSRCRELQQARSGRLNSELQGKKLEQACRLSPKLEKRLAAVMEQLALSARATHRVMRVARTIADLEGSETIRNQDLLEAVSYRRCQILRPLLR